MILELCRLKIAMHKNMLRWFCLLLVFPNSEKVPSPILTPSAKSSSYFTFFYAFSVPVNHIKTSNNFPPETPKITFKAPCTLWIQSCIILFKKECEVLYVEGQYFVKYCGKPVLKLLEGQIFFWRGKLYIFWVLVGQSYQTLNSGAKLILILNIM